MTEIQERLMQRARKRCGEAIEPCGQKKTLEECFTQLPGGEEVFWFNDPWGNTHIEREDCRNAHQS